MKNFCCLLLAAVICLVPAAVKAVETAPVAQGVIEAGKKGPYSSYKKAKQVADEMRKKGYKCSIGKQGGYYYVYYR